jgi:hypothetical protein
VTAASGPGRLIAAEGLVWKRLTLFLFWFLFTGGFFLFLTLESYRPVVAAASSAGAVVAALLITFIVGRQSLSASIRVGPGGVAVHAGERREATWRWEEIPPPSWEKFGKLLRMYALVHSVDKHTVDWVHITHGQLAAVLRSPNRPAWVLSPKVQEVLEPLSTQRDSRQ